MALVDLVQFGQYEEHTAVWTGSLRTSNPSMSGRTAAGALHTPSITVSKTHYIKRFPLVQMRNVPSHEDQVINLFKTLPSLEPGCLFEAVSNARTSTPLLYVG